jgi:hypothetical protein
MNLEWYLFRVSMGHRIKRAVRNRCSDAVKVHVCLRCIFHDEILCLEAHGLRLKLSYSSLHADCETGVIYISPVYA